MESAYAYLWTSGWVNAVVWCESRWDPNASNNGYYLGLFQIGLPWWSYFPGPWNAPVANARGAIYVLDHQGRSAWSCAPW
jgi:hypothetical protein